MAIERTQSFVEDERGQVGFLLVVATFALFGLLGIIVNTGELVHEKTELQNAVDDAAYTCAGWGARGFNVLSNVNIAVLEIAGLEAILDAIRPTYKISMGMIVAGGIVGGVLTAGAAAKVAAKLAKLLKLWYRGARAVEAGLRPLVKAAKPTLMAIQRSVVASWPVVMRVAGVAAGRDASRGIEVFPWPLHERLPVREGRMRERSDVARRILKDGGHPVGFMRDAGFWSLIFFPPSMAVWLHQIDKAHRKILRRSSPPLILLDPPAASMSEEDVVDHFQFVWVGRRRARENLMPGLFSKPERARWAVSQSMVFNPVEWDLLTPKWEASLVPVTRPEWLSRIPLGSRLSGALPIHH